jgi:hypothetical protein
VPVAAQVLALVPGQAPVVQALAAVRERVPVPAVARVLGPVARERALVVREPERVAALGPERAVPEPGRPAELVARPAVPGRGPVVQAVQAVAEPLVVVPAREARVRLARLAVRPAQEPVRGRGVAQPALDRAVAVQEPPVRAQPVRRAQQAPALVAELRAQPVRRVAREPRLEGAGPAGRLAAEPRLRRRPVRLDHRRPRCSIKPGLIWQTATTRRR